MGSWVAGLEIDLSGTGIRGSTTFVAPSDGSSETLTDRFKLLGSARARLGSIFLWPSVLFYGTGGLAWTRLEHEDVSRFSDGTANGSTTPSWLFGTSTPWKCMAVDSDSSFFTTNFTLSPGSTLIVGAGTVPL